MTPRTSLSGPYAALPATFAASVLVFAALVLVFGLAPVEADAARKRAPAGKRLVCKGVKTQRLCWYKRTARVRTGGTVSPGAPPIAPTPLAPPPQPGTATRERAPLPDQSKPATAPPLVPVPQAPPPPAPTPDCGTSPWVGYTAEDVDGVFKLTGKRTCVPGPAVMFQLRNSDAQDHNLYAEAPGQPKRAIIESGGPGETKEAAATLARGEWRLFCDIEGHESMSRTLTVLG